MELRAGDRDELVRFGSMFSDQDAEDLVHAAVVRVLERRKDPLDWPPSYLRTTMRRVWIDRHRSRVRKSDQVSLDRFRTDLL